MCALALSSFKASSKSFKFSRSKEKMPRRALFMLYSTSYNGIFLWSLWVWNQTLRISTILVKSDGNLSRAHRILLNKISVLSYEFYFWSGKQWNFCFPTFYQSSYSIIFYVNINKWLSFPGAPSPWGWFPSLLFRKGYTGCWGPLRGLRGRFLGGVKYNAVLVLAVYSYYQWSFFKWAIVAFNAAMSAECWFNFTMLSSSFWISNPFPFSSTLPASELVSRVVTKLVNPPAIAAPNTTGWRRSRSGSKFAV